VLDFNIGFRFPNDIIDILVVTFVIYRILLMLKGTRAFQMLMGLILIVGAFVGSQVLELLALHWILNAFLSSFILVVVVLFQSDIRRALAQMVKHPWWSIRDLGADAPKVVEELVRSSVSLANKKIGGLIVIENDTMMRNHVEGGVLINGMLGRELIQSIFLPYSPIHDGAVVVAGNKIIWAGCFLPLTTRLDIDQSLGTRHRAAMGITEETDAVAIVISEETGAISLVINGRITRDLDGATLRKVLTKVFETSKARARPKKNKPVQKQHTKDLVKELDKKVHKGADTGTAEKPGKEVSP
jgi:diadenylate cyclase